MTPETKAKKVIRDLLDASGAYYVMPIGTGYGRSGVPDYIGLIRGAFFACEVKADTELTELQKDNLRGIEDEGGYPFVVRIKGKDAYGLISFAEFIGVWNHGSVKRYTNHLCGVRENFRDQPAGSKVEPGAEDNCSLSAQPRRKGV